MRDMLVLGGGPAGVTAAIYAHRFGLDVAILTLDIGGQPNLTTDIENYPGFPTIKGIDFSKKLKEHLEYFNIPVEYKEVQGIEKKNGYFVVKTSDGDYEAKTVIIALGRKPKKLEVPGESEFEGRGVSYCAVCDGFFFKGKIIAVVGGGDAAVIDALHMAGIAQKVYLIHRRQEFRAAKILVDRLKQKNNVELVLDSVVKEIKGDKLVKSIVVENVKTGEKKEIALDGVFIAIGSVPNTCCIEGFLEVNERKEIIVNDRQETSVPGVYAAGDVTNFPHKQIVIAEGQGAVAATEAFIYLSRSGSK